MSIFEVVYLLGIGTLIKTVEFVQEVRLVGVEHSRGEFKSNSPIIPSLYILLLGK